jgi:NADPH:quinone reductase-like Zn-dependent oxidoreductase
MARPSERVSSSSLVSKVSNFRLQWYAVRLKQLNGADGAGEIVEVGSDVDLFKVGDRVTAMPMPGHNAVSPPSKRHDLR